jgi:hypothetical protein
MVNTKCVVWFFSATFVWNISHSKKSSARCYHKCTYIDIEVKHPIFLSDFDRTRIFSADFPKILKYQISRKSVQGGGSNCCSMRADRQTDMTKYQSIFAIFQTRQKKQQRIIHEATERISAQFRIEDLRDSLAQTRLQERDSSVPGYDVVFLGKYLLTLLRNPENYLPSQTASYLQQQRRENPTSIFTKNNLLSQPCQLVTRRITTFRSTTDRIYDGGSIRL